MCSFTPVDTVMYMLFACLARCKSIPSTVRQLLQQSRPAATPPWFACPQPYSTHEAAHGVLQLYGCCSQTLGAVNHCCLPDWLPLLFGPTSSRLSLGEMRPSVTVVVRWPGMVRRTVRQVARSAHRRIEPAPSAPKGGPSAKIRPVVAGPFPLLRTNTAKVSTYCIVYMILKGV